MRNPLKPVWMVPVYRHVEPARVLAQRLLETPFPVVAVDDGNAPPLDLPGVTVLRHDRNLGKGAAVATALRWAGGQGFTHAVQIDADGQHRVEDALTMVARAECEPGTLISGFPVYDGTVPSQRASGRKVTRFFIWLETGVKGEDGLCGCRVYPVARAVALLPLLRSRRMGFDVEVIVRWLWNGWPLFSHPVHVTYPENGVSNFRMVHDNITFFMLHARLCFQRLFRCYRRVRAGEEMA